MLGAFSEVNSHSELCLRVHWVDIGVDVKMQMSEHVATQNVSMDETG